ncbi:MAG: dTMP kinase [Bacteroidetes bacterium]|nr:dTMP kinase [Bacteroidota bacterium]
MLITFEGIDGCGKTTQIGLLSALMKEIGKDVLTLREPGGTEFSEKIRDLLLHSKDRLTPQSELFLFESARTDLVEKVVKPSLEKGTIVILDRFYDSTTAYQGYGRLIDLSFVKASNEIAISGVKPDVTFFLDIPLEISYERSNHRELDKIEKSGDSFFHRVIEGYKQIAKEEPERIVSIDGAKTKEEIFEIIKEKVKCKLQNEELKIINPN